MKKYYSQLKFYTDYEEPMCSILSAAKDGIPKMKIGKKYQLKQIVELGKAGLWDSLTNYQKKCVGATFSAKCGKGEFSSIKIDDPEKSPLKYIKD